MKLTIDFEARSTVDLRKTNAWVYAEHPTTQIMCMALKVNHERPKLFIPRSVRSLYGGVTNGNLPRIGGGSVKTLLKQATTIEAHNVSFEIALWTHKMVPLGFPDLREEPYFSKLRCSASVAAMHALPRALGKVAGALELDNQKDSKGHSLMLQMCKPRQPRKAEREANPDWANTLYWFEDPDRMLRQARYCLQDVNCEHEVSERLGELPAAELAIWRLDQRANWRGVVLDQGLCRKMVAIRDDYTAEIGAEFETITGFTPTKVVALAEFAGMKSVGAEEIVEALLRDDLTPDVRRALEIRQAFAKTSLKKLDTALNCVSADGRMRANLMYHGASTGRWTGTGMQLQNLPSRGLIEDVGDCIDFIDKGVDAMTLKCLYPDLQLALSSCIRGVLRASDGMELYVADFSSIEGRVLAWLAGDQHIIDGYNAGLDMYKIAASGVYHVKYEDVTKDQRTVGKIPELAGGYQGGWRAYATFAKTYRLSPPQDVIESLTQDDFVDWQGKELNDQEAGYQKWFQPIVKAWRANRPGTVDLWYGLGRAAMNAVREPGRGFNYRGISFGVADDFLKCLLPSGRMLYYYQPTIYKKEGREALTFMGADSTKGGAWLKQYTYGGKLCENVAQAIARDIMAEAMVRVDNSGVDMLFTVHDEIVSEGQADLMSVSEYEDLLTQVPKWAAGCPIGAEGWKGSRYRK